MEEKVNKAHNDTNKRKYLIPQHNNNQKVKSKKQKTSIIFTILFYFEYLIFAFIFIVVIISFYYMFADCFVKIRNMLNNIPNTRNNELSNNISIKSTVSSNLDTSDSLINEDISRYNIHSDQKHTNIKNLTRGGYYDGSSIVIERTEITQV